MSSKWVMRHELDGKDQKAPKELEQWAQELTISKELAELLWRRGLHSPKEISRYLNPSLSNLIPLEQWPQFINAAQIIAAELAKGKILAVFGDYDVDGVTSTALVLDFMRKHGLACLHHIPDRIKEGYGLNVAAVELLASKNAGIILTVDCGISDLAGVARARELGLSVIISDHHLPAATLPDANAICNPRMGESPCPALAGVGVAFLLMAALNIELSKQNHSKIDIRQFLDLVALGTLADVVDLSGQNRILVKNGLLLINEGKRPGIAALKAVSGFIANANIDATQVVFNLAPRINAAGRVGQATSALQLLLSTERQEAEQLANELNKLNLKRREEEECIAEEAQAQALEQINQGRLSLVLYAPHWHSGIVGIVASRMIERFYRPTIILCDQGTQQNTGNTAQATILKGSGRSVSAFDLHAALTQLSEMMLSFGGHKQAAGLTIAKENLELFRSQFDEIVKNKLGDSPLKATVKIDGEINLKQASSFNFLKELEMLQPFGMGNPEPVFSADDVVLKSFRQKGNFVQFDVMDAQTGLSMKAKAWRRVEIESPGVSGTRLDLAFSPRINRYNGIANIELQLKDWKGH